MAASFLGPTTPLIALGVDYLYDRRDLMFTTTGTPVQAIATDRSVLPLSALHDRTAPLQATLSINTRLTDSARRMGLRNGDPVGVLVTGSGLAYAKRARRPDTDRREIRIAMPNGDYAVTALGSREKSLFTVAAPYQVAAGNTTTPRNRKRELALPLAATCITPGGGGSPITHDQRHGLGGGTEHLAVAATNQPRRLASTPPAQFSLSRHVALPMRPLLRQIPHHNRPRPTLCPPALRDQLLAIPVGVLTSRTASARRQAEHTLMPLSGASVRSCR